jgi:hypothetical protein
MRRNEVFDRDNGENSLIATVVFQRTRGDAVVSFAQNHGMLRASRVKADMISKSLEFTRVPVRTETGKARPAGMKR